MSYQLLSNSYPVARKDYPCIWCPETIAKGTKHRHERSKYEGEFQDHRWHVECNDAAQAYFRKYGEDEFEPHANKRGTRMDAGQ